MRGLGSALLLPLAASSCIDDPSAAACENYTYPAANARADLANLCTMMPRMPGCSLRRLCAAGKLHGAPCVELSLLGDVCTETDMPTMHACARGYNKLCAPADSVVAECKSAPPLPELPTTKAAGDAALAECDEMPTMAACANCNKTACPDPLLSLSALCLAMPTMPPCDQSGWKAMCGASPDGSLPPLCGASGPPDEPEMRMYFHVGYEDYLLFYSWVPRGAAGYYLACAAVAAFAAASVALRGVRTAHELRERARAPTGAVYRANARRAAFVVFGTTLDYSLMLVAMTFNVGLFCSLIAGFGLGTLLFGHWGHVRADIIKPGETHAQFAEPGHAAGGLDASLLVVGPSDCCS